MATIAMPHIGLAGHLIPAVRLGRVLVAQGHRVIAWVPERYRGLAEATGVEVRVHEPVDTWQPPSTLLEFSAMIVEATERCVEGLIEELLVEEVELVVHDVHVPWARVAGDFLGLSRVVTDPLFPARESPVPITGRISLGAAADLREIEDRGKRARDAVARRWGVDLGGWEQAMHSSAETVIRFSIDEILGPAAKRAGGECVGPLIGPVGGELPSGREQASRPLVYVAFGTFFNGYDGPFRLALEALADLPVEVLLSTGGGPVGPEDLAPVPGNATVARLVSSTEVLRSAAVHVTHGGATSVHESLWAGVPLVCLPLGSDQPLWAERVAQLGAGRIVGFAPESIREAVTALLEGEDERREAERLSRLLGEWDGPARIRRLLKHALAASV